MTSIYAPLILLIGGATFAQNPSTDAGPWSVEKIVQRAIEHAPETKALEKDIERAEYLARQAGKWDNPDASLSYGPMTQSGLAGVAFDASIRQSIPLFGQKAIAERIGEQNKTTTEIASASRLLALKHEVIRITYRLAALNEQADHIAHRRENIELIGKYLQTRPFASPSQAVEKSLLLNRLREIEEKFLEITSARQKMWQALNVFLALDQPIVPDVKWNDSPREPNREELWKLAEGQNPDLKRQESVIATASLEADQAGKKGFPNIRVGGGYSEQTADLPQKIYGGAIEFSLPIFDRGGYAKQAAHAQKEAETHRMEQKRRELNASFEQHWLELVQNRKRIELYPTTLVQGLEDQLRKAEQNWKKGLVSVIAFLELENQVHDQAFKVYDAQSAYIESLSRVFLLSGIPFEKGTR